jgi:hypothetical protein
VINLAGLASEEARDSFVNRLQMPLFTFIKRKPSAIRDRRGAEFRPLRSGNRLQGERAVARRAGAQYGLGMIFATQTPKGIDNKIVSNGAQIPKAMG